VRNFLISIAIGVAGLLGGSAALAQDLSPIPRKIPPQGIEVPREDRQRLKTAAEHLAQRVSEAKKSLHDKSARELLPDVEVCLKAVEYALAHDEFFSPKDADAADEILKLGEKRLDELLQPGSPTWVQQTGLVVRGYRSALDDSVQPYGLVIPEKLAADKPAPLYVWLHGRGDKATDLQFIRERLKSPGSLVPEGAIVLHPFGRYCNAFKFAGEVDVFESIAAVQKNYKTDPTRIVICGFSMGGAGSWHLGAHYPDRWVAVHPGAGFAETKRYQKITPEKYPPWYEQTLWGLYDAPDYVRNLFNLPVVAYSGEDDPQMQAATVMEEAYEKEGQKLKHLIGPGMGHKYHPDTLAEVRGLLAEYVAKGSTEFPRKISLQTRTLRYNRCRWVEILALDEHWQDSRVDAQWEADNHLHLKTKNIAALKLTRPWEKEVAGDPGALDIDGQKVELSADPMILEKVSGQWTRSKRFPGDSNPRKVHGLQGPIDDVFLAPFLVVTPSGKSADPRLDRWVAFEVEHFRDRWRRLFRGDVRMKPDTEVTGEDLKNYHLILWGDAQSNKLLAQIADQLPIRWDAKQIVAGEQTFASPGHALTMICPNPLDERHYVVLNSGTTFREGHDGTNSLQTPKLPDWAVIDLSEPPGDLRPGKIVDAGFFDESWNWKARGK
jgi:predicted esterase